MIDETPGNAAKSPAGTGTVARKRTSGKTAKPIAKGQPGGKPDGQTVLLSGGNPQIAKGEGDGPAQAYIAAMPGWKRDVGRHLDALIVRTVPGVRKAVKWNSLLYGIEGQGWFLGVHCFTRYVKIAFFRGTSMHPVPPVSSRNKDTRYFHIHEDDARDDGRLAVWVKQASELPGERL